jgi:hypothetical protein
MRYKMSSFDFSEFDPEETGKGGLPKPGKCHLLVSEVKVEDEYISVTHEILAHEDSSQVGKISYNNFSLSGKGAKRLQLFLEATKVLTRQDIIDAKARGETSIDPVFEDAETRTYFGTLKASEYNGKDRCKVEWDFKAADDPDAADYPRNEKLAPLPEGDAADAPEAPAGKKEACPF